jgi:ubiquinone/menaquinone biosynthesis C-methylase UbiE
MQEYYNRRAREYEQIYHRSDPIRQQELETLADEMRRALHGLDILEVACGTGYWTERLAPEAGRILATDASLEMLHIAAGKPLPPNVRFAQADAYRLDALGGTFSGGLANFWFSHVPKDRVPNFLESFNAVLRPGARVFLADNCYIPGVGGELVTVEDSRDTYKRRYLADGSEHLVLKNYYTAEELSDIFSPYATGLRVQAGVCFWWVRYELKQLSRHLGN